MRDNSDVPIIMLTAKGEVEDRIIGLELGADDYLVKPFSPRELVARARALLRRVHAATEPQREVLEFGELTIDVSGHKVLVNNEEIDLKQDLDDDMGFNGNERYQEEDDGTTFESETVAVDSEFEDSFAMEHPDMQDDDDFGSLLDEFSDFGIDDDSDDNM